MKTKYLIIAALLFAIAGCVPSLHPLYTKDTAVFHEDLLGTWDSVEDTWTFTRNKDDELPGYHLEFTNKKLFSSDTQTFHYDVHLVKLDEFYFLDFVRDLTAEEDDIMDDGIAPMIPVHSFARVDFSSNKMKLRMFDYEFVKKLFKQQKIRLKHETLQDGKIVLTAPTEDLQKFVLKYADHPDAYISEETMTKRES